MNRGNIAALILIASVSVCVAYFIASTVIGSPTGQTETVKTVDPIPESVSTQPDSTVFNKDAINPTVEVIIGGKASN